MGKPKNEDSYGEINRKLNILIAIQLAKAGFGKKEVAKILGISDNTIQEMFAGKWTKIQREENE